jgi:hypothetical protein
LKRRNVAETIFNDKIENVAETFLAFDCSETSAAKPELGSNAPMSHHFELLLSVQFENWISRDSSIILHREASFFNGFAKEWLGGGHS